MGAGGSEESGPVLGFDAADPGGEKGELAVLEVGHAGDAGPRGPGFEFDGVGDDVGRGGERRVFLGVVPGVEGDPAPPGFAERLAFWQRVVALGRDDLATYERIAATNQLVITPEWLDDPGLFDLPYDPSAVSLSFAQAASVAAGWGPRLSSEPAEDAPSYLRRMPANWSDLSPSELRTWGIESLEGLDAEAEQARASLVQRIGRIGKAGRRFAARRAEARQKELAGV